MFDNFELNKIEINGISINYRRGGSGNPLLLLHGYPQTHLMWRKIAPMLAEHYTVICSDLRGYGDSDKPNSDPKHLTYSKKSMSIDQVNLMQKLGYNYFSIIGHDRGARVAHRMGLDFPDNIDKMALLDIVPTTHVFENTDQDLATKYYHWFFLIQNSPFPETLIGNNPEYYLRSKLQAWSSGKDFISEDIVNEYLKSFSDPKCIHATCEDYRAGASVDLEDHKKDRNTKLVCPLLVLWGSKSPVAQLYEPLSVWKDWAKNVKGQEIDSGHYIPEENPQKCYDVIYNFLNGS